MQPFVKIKSSVLQLFNFVLNLNLIFFFDEQTKPEIVWLLL